MLKRGCHLSLSQMAMELGTTRETVKRRLDDARIDPSGVRGGHPVFRLRDALRAWSAIEDGNRKPDAMPLAERGRFYEVAKRELEYLHAAGALIDAAEVRAENRRTLKIFAMEMDAMPDVFERDLGLTAEQVNMIEHRLDAVRDAIAARLIADDDATDAPASASA
jgi:hypothetical protein